MTTLIDWDADTILALMMNRDQTRAEFARSCRVSRDTVQRWLNGQKPTEDNARQLNRLRAAWERWHG